MGWTGCSFWQQQPADRLDQHGFSGFVLFYLNIKFFSVKRELKFLCIFVFFGVSLLENPYACNPERAADYSACL